MNIAILDDEPSDLAIAETFLKKFIREKYPAEESAVTIKTFTSAIELLRNFAPGQYDLMIVDIRMKEISGMQAAGIIRNRGDNEVKIVFLTNSDDYLLEGYRVFASGYILKPIEEHLDDFNKTFDFIFSKIFIEQKEIVIRSDRVEISVPYKNIFYADINEHHRLCVHLPDREISTAMTYLELQTILLKDPRFLECYHRIIINMDYVKSMGKDIFTLKDGTIIPISQRKFKEVKAKYMHWLAHR